MNEQTNVLAKLERAQSGGLVQHKMPDLSPKLQKALDFIARVRFVDPTAEANGPGACIISSLVVRDFLRKIGFEAEVRSVTFLAKATENGKELHSLGIGFKKDLGIKTRDWDGHLIVVSNGLLIDPAFPQRSAWNWTGTAVSARLIPKAERKLLQIHGVDRPIMASLLRDNGDDGYQFFAV
jgi:hypothetical protein